MDHTLLNPAATDAAFEKHLDEAIKFNFYSVCVSPYVALPVVKALQPYPETKVCTVVGFPHGNIPLHLKLQEANYFIQGGIDEIDWVLHYGEVYNENWGNVELEMGQMSHLCRQAYVVSKCIVEAGVLQCPDLLEKVFSVAKNTGVDFIKTSTGYNGGGANVEHIKLWNSLRGGSPTPYIKASGGIKTADQALALIEAGADRLGLSASVPVMEQFNERENSTYTRREKTPEKID